MTDLVSFHALPEALQRADRLPTLPGVAVEVLRLCREEETTLDDLALVLTHDPALAARLLRFANSSLYNLGQEVTTLQRSCLVLGMKTVQLMALSFSLAETLPRSGSAHAFDYTEFWRRSLICAVAGRTMASVAGLLSADEAFLCGLLSHIGQLVMAECMEPAYSEVLDRSGERWPTASLEQEVLGFDHNDIGAALLSSWALPAVVTAAVGAMTDPSRLDSKAEREVLNVVRVMHLASLTIDLLTCEEKGTILNAIEDKAQEWFELTPDVIYTYVTNLEAGIQEASSLLNLQLPASTSHTAILEAARVQLVELSAGPGRELENSRHSLNLEHRRRLLEDGALRDPITGVPNKTAFDRFFEHEILARTSGVLHRPMGVVLLEVDGFQTLVEDFGDDAERRILEAVGSCVLTLVRKGDLPARISDTTFAVIMSEGHPYGLRALAERLRRGVESATIEIDGRTLSITATLAGACLGRAKGPRDGQALLAAAQKLLARAQAQGANDSLIHPALLGSRE